MRYCLLLGLFGIIGLTSCSTSFQPSNLFEQRINISKNNINSINGSYSTTSKDSNNTSLEYSLLNEVKDQDNNININDRIVKIEIISKDFIEISVFQNDYLLQQKKLEYYLLENDYIEIEVPTKFHHTGWGFFSCSTQETRIALNKDRNLIVDTCGMGTAIFLILPLIAADNHQYGIEYVKIEN